MKRISKTLLKNFGMIKTDEEKKEVLKEIERRSDIVWFSCKKPTTMIPDVGLALYLNNKNELRLANLISEEDTIKDKFVEVETFIALCEKLAPKTIDKVQTNMV